MRALVTGSAGLIGRHMAVRLRELGMDVTGLDIQDPDCPVDVRKFFADDGTYFDLVIHCAAVVGGRALIEESALAHSWNLDIDAQLFRWAERTRPGRVVYFSSCAAYPVRYQTFTRGTRLFEGDLDWSRIYPPDELYGWAKLTGEYLAARSATIGTKVTVVRPFGVYGPGADLRTPLASFAKQVAQRADPVRVWGSGNQVRDFIHITDAVEAVCVLARQEVDGPVNLCSGRPVRLREAARMFADAAGYRPAIAGDERMPAGLEYRVGSPLRLNLYYVPVIALEQGIQDLVGRL